MPELSELSGDVAGLIGYHRQYGGWAHDDEIAAVIRYWDIKAGIAGRGIIIGGQIPGWITTIDQAAARQTGIIHPARLDHPEPPTPACAEQTSEDQTCAPRPSPTGTCGECGEPIAYLPYGFDGGPAWYHIDSGRIYCYTIGNDVAYPERTTP